MKRTLLRSHLFLLFFFLSSILLTPTAFAKDVNAKTPTFFETVSSYIVRAEDSILDPIQYTGALYAALFSHTFSVYREGTASIYSNAQNFFYASLRTKVSSGLHLEIRFP